jgi:hypothetical protein
MRPGKNHFKHILIFFIFLAIGFQALGQEEHLKNVVTAGGSTLFLDNGWGVHAGYNPVFSFSNHLGLEIYAGHNFTNVSGSFISGRKSKIHTSSLLAGPRLYMLRKGTKVRPFINLLAGSLLIFEKKETRNFSHDFVFGLSTGLFVDINRTMLGLYLSSPNEIGFRMGYQL